MASDEQSSFDRAISVKQKFDQLLSGQETAQAAVLTVLMSLSASNPEVRATVSRIEGAMSRATEANTDLLDHLSDLTTAFETMQEQASTKH
jgi:hypothetical protein